MATCDLSALMTSGRCFVPLEAKQLSAVQLALLCDIKAEFETLMDNLYACCESTTEDLVYNATMALDFDGEDYQTVTLAGNIDFATSVNRPVAGRSKSIVVRIICDGSNRTLAFNANWTNVGVLPATINANKVGILSLTAFGPNETDVVYAYNVEA